MDEYLRRYVAGEHERVWGELISFGEAVREEPLLTEAKAVARETMKRARKNIARIIGRLEKLGYKFHRSDEYYVRPARDIKRRISQFESLAGPLPISLRAWYETVGSVCLMGDYPGLAVYHKHIAGQENVCSDPLVVDPFEYSAEYEFGVWQDECEEGEADPTYFPFGIPPDLLHKSNYSGSGAYEIAVPSLAADARVTSEGLESFFVEYLRRSFQWGGFPGWEGEESVPKELISHLSAGLTPL